MSDVQPQTSEQLPATSYHLSLSEAIPPLYEVHAVYMEVLELHLVLHK
jgi:hypothetical protein